MEIGEAVTIIGFRLSDQKKPVIETTEARVTADPALHRVDKRYVQLSGVVGSSQLGAAVVDSAGRLVGVMEPTIETAKVAQIRGAPKRTGFALRHELVKLMFDINGHRYETAPPGDMPAPGVALAPVRGATVAVECWREQEDGETPGGGQAREQKMLPKSG